MSILEFHQSNVELLPQKENFKGAKIRTAMKYYVNRTASTWDMVFYLWKLSYKILKNYTLSETIMTRPTTTGWKMGWPTPL